MPPSGKPDGPTLETLAKDIADQGELLKQLAAKLDALEARVSAEAVKSALTSGQADTLGEVSKIHHEQLIEIGSREAELLRHLDNRFTDLERRLPKPPQPKPDPRIH